MSDYYGWFDEFLFERQKNYSDISRKFINKINNKRRKHRKIKRGKRK